MAATEPAPNPVLFETTRGDLVENRHRAAIAVADASGAIVEAWGDVARPILPRSSVKMLQALPLVESGAATRFGLTSEQLALACASHEGAPVHVRVVSGWLHGVGLSETALQCGPQPSRDKALRRARAQASRIRNNCSGKHAGFLTYALHAGHSLSDYIRPDGAVQRAIAAAFAEITGTEPPLAIGIDGCSAPNFAAPLENIARAMARMADPSVLSGSRAEAARLLVETIRTHPILISGEGRACARLIEATGRRAAVKIGADGVFAGILPESGLGFCLKVEDGDRLAAEGLCAAILVRLGVLDAAHPVAQSYINAPIRNFNREEVGRRRALI